MAIAGSVHALAGHVAVPGGVAVGLDLARRPGDQVTAAVVEVDVGHRHGAGHRCSGGGRATARFACATDPWARSGAEAEAGAEPTSPKADAGVSATGQGQPTGQRQRTP